MNVHDSALVHSSDLEFGAHSGKIDDQAFFTRLICFILW